MQALCETSKSYEGSGGRRVMDSPKGICQCCRRVVSVNRNGKAVRHGYKRFRTRSRESLTGIIGHDGGSCPGSGALAAQVIVENVVRFDRA